MNIITTTEHLITACRQLSAAEFITVDTEFVRDSTYWPILCLVQIAGPEDAYIIDPLSGTLDLAPLYDLLGNPDVIKAFHAARQDIEIFFHQGGVIPAPLFDTQVAAMACGFGDSVSYENVVAQVAKVQIDKSSRFSDWSRRPLSKRLLEYALADVTHLRTVYTHLRDQLAANARSHWLQQEMAVLTDPATYNLDPAQAWKRLKLRSQARRHIGVLIEVAAWREEQAQSRNVPRQRIVKDDVIFEIVNRRPSSAPALEELRGLTKGFSRSTAAAGLLAAIERGIKADPDTLPTLEKVERIQNRNSALVELLKVLLKSQCEHFQVAQKLVASMADLEKIAMDDAADVPALKGWRAEVFGNLALKLKHGDMAITHKKQKIELVSLS